MTFLRNALIFWGLLQADSRFLIAYFWWNWGVQFSGNRWIEDDRKWYLVDPPLLRRPSTLEKWNVCLGFCSAALYPLTNQHNKSRYLSRLMSWKLWHPLQSTNDRNSNFLRKHLIKIFVRWRSFFLFLKMQ